MGSQSGSDGTRKIEFTIPRFVVGIGASAGGLESLEKFFANVPEKTGLAFIVVQHLSPNFKSMMDELLARQTSVPIRVVDREMMVEADTIYLLPPRKVMIISGGRLLVTDKDSHEDFFLPIDQLFRSLGQDQREKSIGIILSGTGGDGSRGIQEIHDAGGLVIAQSEESAAFDGMSRSAQSTGLVDLVLPPQNMPEVLVKYRDNPAIWHSDRSLDKNQEATEGEVNRILGLLKKHYGIDFSNYKPDMIARRIERRLLIGESTDLEGYVKDLAENEQELSDLYRDLLIGVTGFFRDPEAYQRLEDKMLPELIGRLDPSDEFRVWVAATATGEEAYSIAILLHEYFVSRKQSVRCRIFATDVHQESLEFASRGVYSEEQIRDLSPERLDTYFSQQAEGYQVSPELRKMVVFAPHNVITDAPFTKLDLITCRNLFIYFKPEVQRRVLTLFHFGLKVRGGLWLGSSEVPAELDEEFEPIDAHWKMYSKRRDVRLTTRIKMPVSAPRSLLRPTSTPSNSVNVNSELIGTYDQLLDIHMPPSMLVSEQRTLLQTFSGASQFISHTDGRVSQDVLDLLPNDIRVPLSTALRRASRDGAQIDFGSIAYKTPKGTRSLRLRVRPLVHPVTSERSFLIEFGLGDDEPGPDIPVTQLVPSEASAQHIETLEEELRFARESLNASIQELQAANEEMQSTNEELVASNEELQSTNEELHSVNEELYTVNAEYQRKIAELTEMTDDMDNLLNSTHVDTIFLDRDLKLRKFTPDVARIFSLMLQDVGRGIESFTYNLDDEDLVDEIRNVLETEVPFEREVRDRKKNQYLMRILPYVSRGSVDGVVLTLVDITSLRRAESQLAELSDIVRQSDDAIFRLDTNGHIRTWNDGAMRLYGYSASIIGNHFAMLAPAQQREQINGMINKLRSEQTVQRFETRHVGQDGDPIDVAVSISPILDEAGHLVAASVIARDISDQVRAENEIRESVLRRDQFLAMLSHELRNPLGAIVNAGRLLSADPGNEALRLHASDVVLRQSNQMSRLLDDLLDVSRITLGKVDIQFEVLDLCDTIAEAIRVVEPTMSGGGLNFKFDETEPPIYVYGDAARLQQVFVNLLRNAFKYTPQGGDVILSVRCDSSDVEIRVKDTGVGIAEEMIDKVFDMFVQAHNTLERSQGGIGVGLTLVKAIVSMHHGTIEMFSEGIGHGTECRVRLPLTASRPRSEEDEAPRGQEIQRVVVVEDIDDARDMLEGLLRLEGFEVKTAYDGPSGLELIMAEKPDMSLIDIGLPGIDGYEVAKRLRADPSTERLFLTALTGYGQPTDQQAVKAAGFDEHLVKPLRSEDLKRILSRRKQPVTN